MHFFHNTVISSRSGNTTLMRLSTNEEHADVRDNVVYTTAAGDYLALLASSGVLDLSANWLPTGWVTSHDSFAGTLNDDGTNLVGADPGFVDFTSQDYSPAAGSACVDSSGPLHGDALPTHLPALQYVRHRGASVRPDDGARDLGAFEASVLFADGFESGDTAAW